MKIPTKPISMDNEDYTNRCKTLTGDVPCPLSMGALGYAVGGELHLQSLDACRQKHDVRTGLMPNF